MEAIWDRSVLQRTHDPREQLALAERHLLEAEVRLTAHRQRIRHWRRTGQVTQEAAILLRLMGDGLVRGWPSRGRRRE